MSKRDNRIHKSMRAEQSRVIFAEKQVEAQQELGLLVTVMLAVCAFLLGVN